MPRMQQKILHNPVRRKGSKQRMPKMWRSRHRLGGMIMDKTHDLRQWKKQMCNSTDDNDHDPTDKASIIDCIDKHGVIVHSGVNCDRSCPYNE